MKNILIKIGRYWLKRTIRKATDKELLETAMALLKKEMNLWEKESLIMIKDEMKIRGM